MRNILLLAMAILVVLVGGFLLLSNLTNNNGNRTIVQEYRAVLPDQTHSTQVPVTQRPIGQGVREYSYEQDIPATQPDAPNDTVAMEPPRKGGTKNDTAVKGDASAEKNNAAADKNNSAADKQGQDLAMQPSGRDKANATAKNKPESLAKPQKLGSFDKNGVLTLGKAISKNGFHKGEPVVLLVDKGSHFTYVLQKQAGDKVAIVYRASNAIGKSDTPSPPGPYKLTEKTKNPVWVPTKSIDPKQKPVQPYNKDHKNPLGSARLRLDKFDVALHGTNNPDSIRQDASHGCIRHSNKDILKMFDLVDKGSTVIITNQFVGTKLNKGMFSHKR